MHVTTLKPDQVAYDPAEGAFVALVQIRDEGRVYRYACSYAGPIALPFAIAAHRLTQLAKRQHAARAALRSVTPEERGADRHPGPDQAVFAQVA